MRGTSHTRLSWRSSSTVDETANLAILSDDNVLYVDKVTSAQPFGIEARIGSRLPIYCTALGKVLVSHLAPDTIDRYVETIVRLRREGRGRSRRR